MFDKVLRTRFAPSPSGFLHLGHAFAALEARRLADGNGGECLIRIEDIDRERCRSEYVDAIFEDMEWLGIRFDGDVVFQSERTGKYSAMLEKLKEIGVLYPCFCTRREIAAELSVLGRAPQGELIDPYPGTCRSLTKGERERFIREGRHHSWRLDCRKAAGLTGVLPWRDLKFGDQECVPERIGDIILGRKDCPASYHVAVVTDDGEQGVTHVTRGEDLFQATNVHRLLQEFWGLPVPVWYHHPLVKDSLGRRLAKRDESRSIREMRNSGMSAEDVLSLLDATKWG